MGDAPLLTPAQMELWEWMAEYYMCTLGDVMRFAMPAALKPAGLTEEEFRRVEYRPATVRYVKLGPSVADAQALHTALEGLHRAKAQQAALLAFCAAFPDGGVGGGELPRSALSAPSVVLNKLEEKGIFSFSTGKQPWAPRCLSIGRRCLWLPFLRLRRMHWRRCGADSFHRIAFCCTALRVAGRRNFTCT